MKFRPCIDIHNGKVKQIVGSSLRDEGDSAAENFVSEKSAASFASMFRRDGLCGGHVILLNSRESSHYEETAAEARAALKAWPGGLQVGGGITDENAEFWLENGASHVIVTSYVFREGRLDEARLQKLLRAVGREHIVLDLSCKRIQPDPDAPWYIMTDRWQTCTQTAVDGPLLRELSACCDEFLVHGISVEGKGSGIDCGLVSLLGTISSGTDGTAAADENTVRPITYAGGIRSTEDIRLIEELGRGRVDYTVGSALDLYGGSLPYEIVRGLWSADKVFVYKGDCIGYNQFNEN